MKYLYIMLINFIILNPAGADTRRGNGGFAVRCKNSKNLFTLDTVEGIQKYGKTPQAKSDNLGFEQVLNAFIWRYCEIKGSECLDIDTLMKQFSSRYTFVNQVTNIEIDKNVELPSNCKQEQIAFRGTLVGKNYLVIKKSAWIKLSIHEKAVLLLHEVLYTHYLENNKYQIKAAELRNITYLISINELEMARIYLSLLR